MAIKITPLSEVMGAEVSGLEPQPGLSARLNAALQEHIVLCIRGEVLEPLDFLELARGFGTPQLQLIRRFRHPDVPEVTILSSNLDSEGKARAKGEKPAYQATYWHTDDSYKAVPCAKTMLHALEVPRRGGRGFWRLDLGLRRVMVCYKFRGSTCATLSARNGLLYMVFARRRSRPSKSLTTQREFP